MEEVEGPMIGNIKDNVFQFEYQITRIRTLRSCVRAKMGYRVRKRLIDRTRLAIETDSVSALFPSTPFTSELI